VQSKGEPQRCIDWANEGPYADVDKPAVTIVAQLGVCRNKGVFHDEPSGDADMTLAVLAYYQQTYIVGWRTRRIRKRKCAHHSVQAPHNSLDSILPMELLEFLLMCGHAITIQFGTASLAGFDTSRPGAVWLGRTVGETGRQRMRRLEEVVCGVKICRKALGWIVEVESGRR
jgi:hypothetical protein